MAGDASAERSSAISTNGRALRLLLAVTLDRGMVSACLGSAHVDERDALWPSTLYAWAAETAARSACVWQRCARALDDALAPCLPSYESASVAQIAETLTLREASAALTGHEIAAALWAVVRRRDPSLQRVVERLTAEAELLIIRGGKDGVGDPAR